MRVLNNILPLSFQEELGKLMCIWQALNTTVHITRISKIGKSTNSSYWVIFISANISIIDIKIIVGKAFILMEFLVFFEAVVVAVGNLLALAYRLQDILVVAPFANTDFKLFSVFEREGKLVFFWWSEFDDDGRTLRESEFTKSDWWFDHVI